MQTAQKDQSPLEIVNATIEWTRRREGHYYDEGTAALMSDIRDALLAKNDKPFTSASVRRIVAIQLRKHCKLHGMTPSIEVAERDASVRGYVGAGFEYAGWESGPFEWAIQTGQIIYMLTGILAEPYYSFDLCFSGDSA